MDGNTSCFAGTVGCLDGNTGCFAGIVGCLDGNVCCLADNVGCLVIGIDSLVLDISKVFPDIVRAPVRRVVATDGTDCDNGDSLAEVLELLTIDGGRIM